MALLPDDTRLKDGLQLGGPTTLCYKCEAERIARDRDSDIPYGDLEYKEVFRIVQSGNETCICMRHFKQMCAESHYMLIDTNESMAVPLTAFEEQSEAESITVGDMTIDTDGTVTMENTEAKKVEPEEPVKEEKSKKKSTAKKDK